MVTAAIAMPGTSEKVLVVKQASELNPNLSFAISAKGGLSVYGLQRFPVTLYGQQWKTLLDCKDEIELFMADNAKLLAEKQISSGTKATDDKPETYTVSAQDIAVVAAEADRLTKAGDVAGAIKYATIKSVAEMNRNKVSFEILADIVTLKARK